MGSELRWGRGNEGGVWEGLVAVICGKSGRRRGKREWVWGCRECRCRFMMGVQVGEKSAKVKARRVEGVGSGCEMSWMGRGLIEGLESRG